MSEKEVSMGIKELMKDILAMSIRKGFWGKRDKQQTRINRIPQTLCLIHSEVSEAMEEYREGIHSFELRMEVETFKPVGFSIELADVVMRCLDLAAALGIDLEEAIRLKMEYNKTRPDKHGKVC